jgi:hypothetical protein
MDILFLLMGFAIAEEQLPRSISRPWRWALHLSTGTIYLTGCVLAYVFQKKATNDESGGYLPDMVVYCFTILPVSLLVIGCGVEGVYIC